MIALDDPPEHFFQTDAQLPVVLGFLIVEFPNVPMGPFVIPIQAEKAFGFDALIALVPFQCIFRQKGDGGVMVQLTRETGVVIEITVFTTNLQLKFMGKIGGGRLFL